MMSVGFDLFWNNWRRRGLFFTADCHKGASGIVIYLFIFIRLVALNFT